MNTSRSGPDDPAALKRRLSLALALSLLAHLSLLLVNLPLLLLDAPAMRFGAGSTLMRAASRTVSRSCG